MKTNIVRCAQSISGRMYKKVTLAIKFTSLQVYYTIGGIVLVYGTQAINLKSKLYELSSKWYLLKVFTFSLSPLI